VDYKFGGVTISNRRPNGLSVLATLGFHLLNLINSWQREYWPD